MTAEPASGVVARARPVVLVVDDDDDCRALLAEILDRNGYSVRPAASGADALALLDAGTSPDAMILDLMMPEMNGWDLLDAMRARPGLDRLPVVVVTAAFDPQRAPIEASHVLPKPFRVDALLGAVADCCRRRRPSFAPASMH